MLRNKVSVGGMLWTVLVATTCCVFFDDSGAAWAQGVGAHGITERKNQTVEESCDVSAQMDLLKLRNALERLKNELSDLGCDRDAVLSKLLRSDGPRVLGYLIGPYYGWAGTKGACAGRIRIVGDELHGFSLRGQSPDGKPEIHWIYRVSLRTLEELPPISGPCVGDNYYRDRDDHCSVSSMISPNGCGLVKPSMQTVREVLGHKGTE